MKHWFARLWSASPRRKAGRPCRLPLRLEQLEDRLVPAAITVTTPLDEMIPNDGTVSLREATAAITAGNDLGDPDIAAQNPGTFGVNDTVNILNSPVLTSVVLNSSGK